MIEGLVTLYKAFIGDFQLPTLKWFIPNLDASKYARPHVSIVNILHILSSNGAYGHSILYYMLMALQIS
jgi:hypothetical protein